MKKISVKVLSIILCIATIFSCLPFSVFAQEDTRDVSAETTESIVQKTALDRIVTNLSDGSNNNDYSISYLETKDKTAYVTVNNVDECSVVVAIYNEDSGKLVASGISKVPVEHKLIEVEIDIATMPEFYIAKAFLVDEENAPLCNSYKSLQNTKAYKEFLAKAPEDYDTDSVIIFNDEKEQEDFAVLVDDVVVHEVNSGVTTNSYDSSSTINQLGDMTYSYNAEQNVYVFNNASEDVKNLKTDDVFYCQYGEKSNEFILFKVKDIKVSGKKVTITEETEVGLEDFFEFIRVDDDGDYEDVEIDEDKLGSALTKTDKITTQSKPDISEEETRSYSTSFKLEYPKDSDEAFNSGKYIKGELGLEIKVHVKLSYDVVLLGKDYYEFKNETTVKLGLTKIEIGGKFELNQDVVRISTGPIPVGPFTFELFVAPLIEVSAKVEFTFTYTYTQTITADSDNGMEKTKITDTDWPDAKVEAGIEIAIGATIGVEVSLVKIVELGLSGDFGVKYEGKINQIGLGKDRLHNCYVCVYGDVYGFVDINIDLKITIIPGILEFTPIGDELKFKPKDWYIFDFYISISKDGFKCGQGNCKNIYYKTNVKVFYIANNTKELLSDATVSSTTCLCDSNADKKYEERTIKTDNNGLAIIYFRPGQHTINVSHTQHGEKSETIRIIENEKNMEIVLNSSTTDPENPDTPITPPTSGVSWKFDAPTSTLTIYGKGAMDDYSSFGSAPWDAYRDSIKKIVVEEGVTSIGNYAFAQCMKAQTVSLPSTLTKIGMASFYQCDALQSVTLPAKVTSVGDYAFYGCYSMTKLGLGSVKTLGMYSFAQCTGLTNVNVPSTTTNVGESAFGWCQILKSISFSNKNCTIYDSANTIYSSATIYGASGSTAQKYANKYGRSFVTLQTASVVDTTKSYDSLAFTFNGCVPGNEYILLNVTGYGAGFVLSTSNLEYINQFTADNTGKVSNSFIPRNIVPGNTTLLIGDFGNGAEAKEITTTVQSTAVSIDNNPGTKKINYREGISLTATATSPIDGTSIEWYVNGEYYSTGNEFICKELEHSIEVTVKLVDANGNSIIVNGKEVVDQETIKVDDSFFKRLSAFFKFTLFGQEVIKTN